MHLDRLEGLGAYALVLVGALGGGAVVGATIGPDPSPPATHGDHAADASTPLMRPCATLLRKTTACSIPTRFKSSTNVPAPVRKRRSSARLTG